MSCRKISAGFFILLIALLTSAVTSRVQAQGGATDGTNHPAASTVRDSTVQLAGKDVPAQGGGSETHGENGEPKEETRGTFDADHGTWLNWPTRQIFGLGPVEQKHGEFTNIKYDFIVISVLTMLGIMIIGIMAGKKAKLRPEGKPSSLPNLVEAAVEGYRDYLVSVMGQKLAYKYAPLVSSFFFAILIFNWMGLVPGMVSPTANPNISVAMALVAFVAVHFIAIKETNVKSWFMHFVGEPLWLAPLNFPLHMIGELIKPMSLSIRLLCNVFGEEMVALQLSLLAVGAMAVLKVPIPFQLPMMLLGVFFGFLQALVFSTLLAIYISILGTDHSAHDAHNEHGSIEEVRAQGHTQIVGHPSETSIA